jgi:hypothetical protein
MTNAAHDTADLVALAAEWGQPVEGTKTRARSVVKAGYKNAYEAAAKARGATTKAAKRANGDWLAQELEAECVSMDGKFALARFVAILEANGIADPLGRWPNRNTGWEGRIRMSGSCVLRGILRKTGVFRTAEGAEIDASAMLG